MKQKYTRYEYQILCAKKTESTIFKNCINKKFRKQFYLFLIVLYLIMWLMKALKNFGKIAVLKIWELVFLGGVKTSYYQPYGNDFQATRNIYSPCFWKIAGIFLLFLKTCQNNIWTFSPCLSGGKFRRNNCQEKKKCGKRWSRTYPSPKVWDIIEKRLHWASVVRDSESSKAPNFRDSLVTNKTSTKWKY